MEGNEIIDDGKKTILIVDDEKPIVDILVYKIYWYTIFKKKDIIQ